MSLTRKQKKYLIKYLKKKSLDQIAVNLSLGRKELEDYLEKRWGKKKYKEFSQTTPKTISTLETKVSQFNFWAIAKKRWFIFIFLALLVFVAYANSLNNEFLSDDIAGIQNNQNLDGYRPIFSSPLNIIRSFQPALYTTINLLFGKIPAVFRLVNIFFHLGTVIVSYFVFLLLLNPLAAFFAASIMAVHPIAIEAVTWISGGTHVFYSFFLMLSLLFYLLMSKKKLYIYLSFLIFFFAVAVSEKAISFPLILACAALSYKIFPKNWKKLILAIIPFLIIGGVLATKIPERVETFKTTYYQQAGLGNPILMLPVAVASYLELIFWPQKLTLYHSENVFSSLGFVLFLTIFSILLIAIVWSFKKNRSVFFWLSFFTIGLLPAIVTSWFGLAWIVAERYVYFSAIGIFALVGLAIQKTDELGKKKWLSYGIFSLILLLLLARTIVRNIDWKNQDNLWLAAAKTSPSSPQNHNNLGDLYARHGNLEKAAEEFQIAIELKPNYGDAYHNLANIYSQMGKSNLAIENYQKALSLNPNLWQSHQNIAALLFNQENYEPARQEVEKAIEVNPENSGLHVNLGMIFLKLNQALRAQEEFQKALQIDPENQQAKQFLLQTK